MHQFINRFDRKYMIWLVNSLVFMFFVTIFSIPKGYSYAPIALAVIGGIYLFIHLFVLKKRLEPSKADKWLIFAFVFYFGLFALSAIIHGDGFREIDDPSRVLLFLPLLLLFRVFPINLKTIWYGIPIGSALSGLVAIYQKFYLALEKPFPYLMHIQAGDMAISLAMMSLAIAIYWGIKKNYTWMIFSLIAAGAGILASALTGARGGWVGLPIVLAIILGYSYKHFSKKITSIIVVGLVITISSVIFIPQTNVLNRINIAYDEVVNYFESNQNTSSVGARFDMWQSAFRGIQEKPFLGWGKKGYITLKQQQLEQGIITENTFQFNDAHNQYIDTTVKKGIIGLSGLLAILLVPLYYFVYLLKQKEFVGLLGVVHIVSILFFFTSQTFLGHNSGMSFYIFLLVVLYGITGKQKALN